MEYPINTQYKKLPLPIIRYSEPVTTASVRVDMLVKVVDLFHFLIYLNVDILKSADN